MDDKTSSNSGGLIPNRLPFWADGFVGGRWNELSPRQIAIFNESSEKSGRVVRSSRLEGVLSPSRPPPVNLAKLSRHSPRSLCTFLDSLKECLHARTRERERETMTMRERQRESNPSEIDGM